MVCEVCPVLQRNVAPLPQLVVMAERLTDCPVQMEDELALITTEHWLNALMHDAIMNPAIARSGLVDDFMMDGCLCFIN